jgi:quercetin dioxygenase-like cupin family protein
MFTRQVRPGLRSPVLALALIVLFAGSALATAPSGFVGTLTSRATLSDTVDVSTGTVKLKTRRAVDFVTATVNLDAPSSSGWHSHPGIVLVSVVSGSVVFYDSNCVATVHPAGSSFVESGHYAGLVRNESTTTPAVVYATYIVRAGIPNTGLRIDMENPGCDEF